MTPENFLEFSDLLPEPTLLVTAGGIVVAVNRATRERLGLASIRDLVGAVVEPPDEVVRYLCACSRSRQMVFGALTLRDGVACRAEGTLVRPAADGADALVLLRLVPRQSAAGQFVALNQRIDELGREVHRRRAAEDTVRRQEEWLRVTLASIGDAVITTDAAGRITFLNPVAEELTGWPKEVAVGERLETVFAIVNEQTRQPVENPVGKVLREGVIVGLGNHTILIARDGTERPIDDSAAPIRDAERTMLGVVLIFRDVTEQRRAEAELWQAERRFRAVFNQQFQFMAILTPEGTVVDANQTCFTATGVEREQVLGRAIWETPWWDRLPAMQEQWKHHISQAAGIGIPIASEMEYALADGTIRFATVAVSGIKDEDGRVIHVVVEGRDDTERRQQESAVRDSEKKLRLLADTIPQLAWMARPDGHIFWYNRRWYEYTGTTPEQMEGWGWQSVHDPKVLPNVLERWKASIATGEPFDMVFPLKGADGRFRPFLTRINPLRDEQGRVLYWFGTNTDIADQKETEERIRESEERFRQLADAMPQFVWTARPDGNIDYLNRQWHEFTGLPETQGNEGWAHILHPDDARLAKERWAISLQNAASFEMEVRLLDRRRQTYRWHLIRTVAVQTATGRVVRWLGTGTDIHEQKRAEESARYLAESSAALAHIVDYESTLQTVANLAVPYFADWSAVDVVNGDGGLRRLAVAHQDPDKIRLVHQLMEEYPPDPKTPGGSLAVLRTGKPTIVSEITDEMLVQGARDERHLRLIRWLGLKSYICVPLVASGNPHGVLTFATAESGRTYTDADLTLARDLAHRAAVAIENTQLYAALREADRRKDEFLATLAHELRNPLAPIRNSLQILKMPRLDAATIERSREMMERQVHQLVRLVDDLLDVSRVMRGKIELRKERVELSTVIARAVETVQPLVEAQEHDLSVQLPPESLALDADPVRLAQVVGNLLTNAAKYTEANGRIRLTAKREGGEAVLRVWDTGIGIAPDMLPHIFELFVQVDHAATRSQGGLGIGLTLVKNLVEMHHGTVKAHSAGLGRGSEFVVRLPLMPQMERQRTEEENREGLLDSPPSGHRLLVVDDNRDAADSLAMLLRLQGHEVRLAHDGPAALLLVAAFHPDLVFLDIGMPGMDGYEVARRLRKTPGTEKVVLAALTGWGQQEDRRRTAEAGFDHHLVKPPEPKDLERLLSDLESKKTVG